MDSAQDSNANTPPGLEHLERAIDLAESQSRLARLMNVNPQAIQGWRKTGQIPPDRVLDISRAVVFQVTPHQLRPDLYPHPDDGLPAELRAQVQQVAA